MPKLFLIPAKLYILHKFIVVQVFTLLNRIIQILKNFNENLLKSKIIVCGIT